jgi:arylsulfatase A-like enzyme
VPDAPAETEGATRADASSTIQTGADPVRAGGTSRLARVVDVLAMAVAAAGVAAALHGLELIVAYYALGELVWVSRDFVWMSPIAYTLVMLLPAAVFVVVALVAPRRWVRTAAAFVFTAAAVFGALLPYPQIARAASLVLALGAGYQVSRLVHRDPVRWARRARNVALGGAALVAVLAVALPGFTAWGERRRLSALPTPAGGPHVLLIILDTVRAASMSLNGYDEPTTPNLQRWAADGVAFDWAFSPAPWTLPSHASVFTGRWAGETQADWKVRLDERDSTLAEIFGARGYATAGFVGNMHYTSWDSGLSRGFARWDDYRRSWRQLVRSSSYTQTAMYNRLVGADAVGHVVNALLHPDLSIDMKHTFDHKDGSEVSAQFLDWQRSVGRRPFFAFLNYFDGHQPYTYTPEFRKFRRQGSGSPAYRAAIAYLDAQVDSVLRVLRERGALDSTIVVVTSDHGELFNEHGLSGHAHNLYKNVLHVPLLLRAPGRAPGGVRVPEPVSLRDLGATILDVAGARAPFPGTSLGAHWPASADSNRTANGAATSAAVSEVSQAPNVDVHYPTARGAMKGLATSDLHYIRNGDGVEELYDFAHDPQEERNLASAPEHADALRRMRDVVNRFK